MAIDQKAIEEHIRGILTALGDDPQREGLADTPARVARMYAEMFEGMNYTNDEIADMFCKTFEEESEFCESDQDMVVVRDIEIFSHCEHHLAHVRYERNSSLRPRRQSHRPQQNRKNRGYGFQAPSAPRTNRS